MDLQTVIVDEPRGRIVAIDSAYDVDERNTGRDVVVSASYSGVLPARFVADRAPRAAIGLDCGIGPEGAGIAGLWFYEALAIPAATVDVADDPARRRGGRRRARGDQSGQRARRRVWRDARHGGPRGRARPAAHRPRHPHAGRDHQPHRVEEGPDGRQVVCADSIAFGTDADTAGTCW